jgi:hypothetical protein
LDFEDIPYEKYADVSEELAARLLRQLPDFLPFEEKINLLKNKAIYLYSDQPGASPYRPWNHCPSGCFRPETPVTPHMPGF